MENQVKVNLWLEQYQKESNESILTNFPFTTGLILKMANSNYDEIFNMLVQGKTIQIANLDLTDTTLTRSIAVKETELIQNNKIVVFTSDDQKIQNTKLKKLLNNRKQVCLTFGVLDYFDDDKMTIKSAPLVVLPLKLEYIDSKNTFQISSLKHEVYLNDVLINKLLNEKRIDISYPLESNFSLLEYLNYVVAKTKNNFFSVNNGCFITQLNLNSYFIYKDFLTRKEEIASLSLVKSLSYINSEFFNLNKSYANRISNNYLSLLDLDNDEYKILKRINLRENMLIRSNSFVNKMHLLSNITNNFLLNKKSILFTYDNEENHDNLIRLIKENHLERYTLDLSIERTSKDILIQKLLDFDKLHFDHKLLDQNRLDEIADTFYKIKNDFKVLINSLRRNSNDLNLSLNQLIYEYYALGEFPLLNINIPDIQNINPDTLNTYLSAISNFIKSYEKLGSHYLDHPFYGFNNIKLNQEQYIELRDKIISLSAEFEPCKKAFDSLSKKYNLPYPLNLYDMKCILNVVSLIPNTLDIPSNFFDLINYDEILDDLALYNQKADLQAALRSKIISLYEEKVFILDIELLNNHLKERPLKRKIIKSYQPFFAEKAKIDEAILSHLAFELNEYYSTIKEVNELLEKYKDFKPYYQEGRFNIDLIKEKFNTIKLFNEATTYLRSRNLHYSSNDLSSFNEESVSSLLVDKKRAQIAFNHLLQGKTYLQKFYDETIIDFASISLELFEQKIEKSSKNFASINAYLDFYLSLRKLNKMIPDLGNQLIIYPQPSTYIQTFMKKVYFDLASYLLNSNPMFKNHSSSSFINNTENYRQYNKHRLDSIDVLIRNNILQNYNKNQIVLKTNDIPYLNNLKENGFTILPLLILLKRAKTLISSLFPIIIIPSKQTSLLLQKSDYFFDVNIIFASDKTKTKEILPAASRAEQIIAIDYIDENLETNHPQGSSEVFILSCLKSLSNVSYNSSSYKANILKANHFDNTLKKYLITKLTNEGFLVKDNINTSLGTIDLLVKVPSSSKATGVMIDRLNYYSLESAIDSVYYSEESLNKLGHAYYHLITSVFFNNEEVEFKKLVNFILENSIKAKEVRKINRNKPLVEVLFKEFISVEDAYYKVFDKANKSHTAILIEVLQKCAPVNKDELLDSLPSDYRAALGLLQSEGTVKIANTFVFLSNHPITFKRVNKENNIIRQLNNVSNEEIQKAIVTIIQNKTMLEDDLIKLILVTLGHKKMNHSQYFKIQNIIQELVEENIIKKKDNQLYFNNL